MLSKSRNSLNMNAGQVFTASKEGWACYPSLPRRKSTRARHGGATIQAAKAPSAVVFRADARSPEEIFKVGFSPRMGNGIKIGDGGQMTGGVSTSKRLDVAIRYAAAYDGYVYAAVGSEGTNILDILVSRGKKAEGLNNALSQSEVAFGSIPADKIIAARRCSQDGNKSIMTGQVIRNPSANVSEQEAQLGIGYLNLELRVPSEYPH